MNNQRKIVPENFTTIEECRLCKSANLRTVLDFGYVPLANAYLSEEQGEEDIYPMTVVKCGNCGHIQLKETVNPEILFSKYSYASSDSPVLLKHFKEYASTLTTKLKLDEYETILEIGSNDGILLHEFARLGFIQLYGVEPAANMAERSMGCGAVIVNKFFNLHTASQIATTHGKMSLVCANNVFAHVADIDSMMEGIKKLLCDEGVFVFENAYLLDTIKGLYFDQCYHEHIQYYGIKPLMQYLDKFGFKIFDIEHVGTQGGSFRVYAQLKSSYRFDTRPSVAEFVKQEYEEKLYDLKTYSNFNQRIIDLAQQVVSKVHLLQSENKTISCYGCPAKFALFSKVFGLDKKTIQYVVDDSPLKQGMFSPGKRIPIVCRDYFQSHPTDYCIISAWNMAESIIQRNHQYKGKWIIPMPEFKIV